MKTYQDYEQAPNKTQFIRDCISEYMSSDEYKIAVIADEYEKQQNVTIREYTKFLYTQDGRQVVDFTSANNKLASNFFHRLNTDRCAYSLGNGVSFTRQEKRMKEDGTEITVDVTKELLGNRFDNALYEAGMYALEHGRCYTFWNLDRAINFPVTQFCPLWDEFDGRLRAGIRFWSLDWNKKPVTVVFYGEDGYIKYRTREGTTGLDIVPLDENPRPYRLTVQKSVADGEEIVGTSNYGTLPIVPLFGNKNKQSTLVGMRAKIDAYDLIQSGFANDLEECAEIYWIIGNAMGMTDKDLARFRDKMKLQHIAVADTDNGSVTPYTHEIPTVARETFLTNIRNSLYEDFGALDVHTVAAGATNDHIDAAYQPMDEEADDFEFQIIQYIQQILSLMGIDDVPQFKRNKISNQMEQTQMVALVADKLDDETLLKKLPFLTVDEVTKVLMNRDEESDSRFDEGEDE